MRAPVPDKVRPVAAALDLHSAGLFYPTLRRTACKGGSCVNDYCRCTKIIGIEPEGFAITGLVEHYAPEDELSAYALERALTKLMRWNDESAFRFEAIGGWYGEELEGVWIEERIAGAMDREAAALAALPDPNARVREALLVEYGELLPGLENAQFEMVSVPRSVLRLGATAHAASRGEQALLPYRFHRGILGLAVPRPDGSLRLLDGYHRTLATDHDPVELVVAYSMTGSVSDDAEFTQRTPGVPRPRPRSLADAMARPRT